MTEKHLRPAGAIRGPSSIGSMPVNASDAAIAVFVGIDHGTLEALCPALVELAITNIPCHNPLKSTFDRLTVLHVQSSDAVVSSFKLSSGRAF